MSIYRVMLAITFCAILSTPALAQPQGEAPQGAAPQGQAAAASDGVTLDSAPFFKEVDANKDNQITKAEWTAAGLVDAVYEMFDKDGVGYFSKESLDGKTHPPTIDSDKDGALTLAELKAHIASQSKGK